MLDNPNINSQPFMRTPFAHILGAAGGQFVHGTICATIELNLKECFEAYGHDKGMKYCRGFVEDHYECRFKVKQIKRRDVLEKERRKQWKAGKFEELYLPKPAPNAY